MNKTSAIYLLVILLMGCGEKEKKTDQITGVEDENWIQLFNGKDLSGWDVKFKGQELGVNYKNTFFVEDGMLKVSYVEYDTFSDEFGHLFYKTPYSHYRLRAEYRFVGQQVPDGPGWAFRNNGFMLHCQSAASMGLDQDFPISVEAQLLGGREDGARSNMNLCTPGSNVVMGGKLRTEHCMNSTSKTYRGDQWITVEMLVYGDSLVHHIVERDTVLTYTNLQMGGGGISGFNPELYIEGKPMREGYIAIQAESHPTEFRKIELLIMH